MNSPADAVGADRDGDTADWARAVDEDDQAPDAAAEYWSAWELTALTTRRSLIEDLASRHRPHWPH